MNRQAVISGVLRRLRPDVTGVAVAALFFCLSLTPSLLPRDWLNAGVIGGINAAIGYGIGVLLGALLRWIRPVGRAVAAVVVAVSFAASLAMVVPAAAWQRRVAALMGIEGPDTAQYLRTPVVALFTGLALVAAARMVIESIRAVARWLIRRWKLDDEVALFVGTAVVVAVIVTLVNGVLLRGFLAGASAVFQPQNTATRPGVDQPLRPERSGSPQSYAPWDTLGFQGRNFVATGPDAADLTGLSGRPAREPIRIYAGLQSGQSTESRVAVLLSELQRTRAFERRLLVIIPTTGTGWVDPVAARSVEALYNGDTALVAMQYSYLPSWISFLADRDKSVQAGRAMVDAVHRRWTQWPAGSRPKLALYGESLGSLAGQGAFAAGSAPLGASGAVRDIIAKDFSSVLWVGPPNESRLWRGLTEGRDPGSPEVQPRYDNGRTVRFAQAAGAGEIAAVAAPPWPGTRVLFLQHASDPVVWWSPGLLFAKPDWLAEPPGIDRSPSMRWYPIVTFWQVSADMAGNITNSARVPSGHGHHYGDHQLDGWVAVAAPQGWTAPDTERVRRWLDTAMAAGGPEFA